MALKKEEEELVTRIKERSWESQKAIFDEIFYDVVVGELKKSEDVVAKVGLYSFTRITRAARKGRNPQTGQEIKIAAKDHIKWKLSDKLSKKLFG